MKSNHTKEPFCDISENSFKCNESIIMQKDKQEKVKKNISFVFSESMLDEFDPEQSMRWVDTADELGLT